MARRSAPQFLVKIACQAVFATAALLAAGTCSSAQAADGPSRAAIEAATDKVWARVHATTSIPGMVVAVVDANGPILLKGYGVRNIETGAPVDPERTLVQVGSVTKIFTALLAARALDAHRLSLDADMRGKYRDLPIDDDDPQPVTVRQLLAHEAGFDGDLSGVMTDSRDQAQALDPARMARHLRRVRDPGILPAYDNAGVGLLGEVAARSLGQTFRRALRQQVLLPLGMTSSSIGLPAERAADAAACHHTEKDGRVTICPHTFMRPGFEGAGALVTTGTDMARFMIAMLNDGRGPNGALLQPQTFATFWNMDTNRFYPGVHGMGWLIEETSLDGRRALFHTGGYDGFSSGVYFLSKAKIAIFVSAEQYADLPKEQNATYLLDMMARWQAMFKNRGFLAVEGIADAIADLVQRDPPDSSIAKRIATLPPVPPEMAAGYYRDARNDAHSLIDRLVLGGLFGATIQATGQRTVTINGQPYDWRGAGLYESRRDGTFAAFRPTSLRLVFSRDSSGAALRVSAWHAPISAMLFMLLPVILLVVSGLGWLLDRDQRAGSACLALAAVALIALFYLFLELQLYPGIYYRGHAVWPIILWRVVYQLALLGGIAAVAYAIPQLLRGDATLRARIAFAIPALVFAAYLLEAIVWGTAGKIAT